MKRFFAFLALVLFSLSAPAFAATTASPSIVGARDISGTVTLGGTYQTVAAQSSSRYNCTVQNPADASEVLLVKIGTMAQPYALAAGQAISTLNGVVSANNIITLTAATTGHVFAGTCEYNY